MVPGDRPDLRLSRAEIQVRFLEGGERRVEERIRFEAPAELTSVRVEHTVAVGRGESLEDLRVASQHGAARVVYEPGQPLSRLTVFHEAPGEPGEREYEMAYSVRGGDEAAPRCPLAVPDLKPDAAHGVVALRVSLPPRQVALGPTFPNLQAESGELTVSTGAVPAFVRVPFGEGGLGARLAAHTVDAGVLVLIAAGVALWLRARGSGR